MDEKARLSRAAWAQSMDACDQTRSKGISLRTTRQLVEALKIVKSLKTQMIELQRQQGPAKDPAEPELPEEANLLKRIKDGINPFHLSGLGLSPFIEQSITDQ
ncbi:hypothetical protein Tco_0069145, partial [Tanacetum coccineum]